MPNVYARLSGETVVEVVTTDMPLSELFPAGLRALFIEVPEAQSLSVQQGWRYRDGAFSAPIATDPSVDQLLAYAAARRFACEVAGKTVNGMAVATDRESQSMIANTDAYLQRSGVASVPFKASSGWIELTADQVRVVALAVGAHVQACFAAENTADAGINAAPPTVRTFADVDAIFAPLVA